MRNKPPVTQQEYRLDPTTTLVSTTDLQSRITYCNPAFVQVSGYAAAALVGQTHNLVRHPDMPAEAFRDLWATLKAGAPWTALVKNRRQDGDHYGVRANVTPVLEAGQVTGYMSVRTVSSRDEVAQADALHAAMRAEAAAGALVYALQQGELRVAGPRGQLARALRPGLGGQLLLTALAGSAASAAVSLPLASLGWWAALPASLLIGSGVAVWMRRLALAPIRNAVAVVRRMSAGDLKQTLQADRLDEAGQLARA